MYFKFKSFKEEEIRIKDADLEKAFSRLEKAKTVSKKKTEMLSPQKPLFVALISSALLIFGGISAYWFMQRFLRVSFHQGKIEQIPESIRGEQDRIQYKFKTFNFLNKNRYIPIAYAGPNSGFVLPHPNDDASKPRLYVYDTLGTPYRSLCVYYDNDLEHIGRYGQIKEIFNEIYRDNEKGLAYFEDSKTGHIYVASLKDEYLDIAYYCVERTVFLRNRVYRPVSESSEDAGKLYHLTGNGFQEIRFR